MRKKSRGDAGVALAGLQGLMEVVADNKQVAEVEIQKLINTNEQLMEQVALLQTQVASLLNLPKEKSAPVENQSGMGKLYQNAPNPFSEHTVIRYYVPGSHASAYINVYSQNGGVSHKYLIEKVGEGEIEIRETSLQPGNYSYELVIDGQRHDIKQFVVLK